MLKGLVFNIQRFSLDDGPGIRTTIFMKGCNLECIWCHNPESIASKPQVRTFPHKCIECGACLQQCPSQAHVFEEDKKLFLREQCSLCGSCRSFCPSGALDLCGEWMTVDAVLEKIQRDMPFYERSGGGITLSGGEPLLQKDFVRELLISCKKLGLHTAIDTAGHLNRDVFETVLPYTDLFLYDLKALSADLHKRITGRDNTRIKDNLQWLAQQSVPIWIRIPVIPQVNDSPEEMGRVASYLKDMGRIEKVELLPYHQLGEGKYESIGKEYRLSSATAPDAEQIDKIATLFNARLHESGGDCRHDYNNTA